MHWYRFIKFAQYEQYREQIEQLSRNNPYPFKDWFEGSDRVYIPFVPSSNQSYFAASDQEVIETLQQSGCDQVDYRGGYCQQGGRTWKITKMIELIRKQELVDLQEKASRNEVYDLERELERVNKYYNEILQQFVNSSQRVGKVENEFSIVISQNPHDVASMSTGRDWTSCMELGEGSHHEAVFCEIQSGGLVAYLIRNSDVNIDKPLARIHIRRFENRHGQSMAVQEGSVYGNAIPGFADVVRQWLVEKQKNTPTGVYQRTGGKWSDTFSKEMLIGPSTVDGVIKWLRGDDEDAKYSTWTVKDELAKTYNETIEERDSYGNYYGESESPIEDNTKTFQSREEAEKYLLEHEKYRGWEEEEFIRDRLKEFDWTSWAERNEDDSDWEVGRYSLSENPHDYTHQMKMYAFDEIMNAEKGTYGDDIIQEIHDELFERLGRDQMKILFAKKYPELMTEEDRNKIRISDTLSVVRALDDDQKEPYKQMYYSHILRAMDDMSILYDSEMEHMAKIYQESIESGKPNREMWDRLVMRFLGRLHDEVFGPVQELFKPVPEDLSQKLVEFVMNIVNDENYHFGKYNDSLLHYLAHTFYITGTDTPTVQNYYEKLLPHWGENHKYFGDDNNKSINVSSIGAYIGKLGENGQQFIPFIQEKLKLEEERLAEIKSDEGLTPYMKGNFYNKSNVIERLKKNIESYLYTLDLLTNKGKPSGKYRFHH